MLTLIGNVRRSVPIFVASVFIHSALAADESHARLGTYFFPLAPAELKAYGVAEPGAVIVGVATGTGAEEVGLKPGDVIAWGKPMRSDHAGPNDDCVYNFGVEITITSGSRTVGLRKGPECTVVLDRIIDVDVISDHAASARRP